MARLSRRDFLKATATGTALVAAGLAAEACRDDAEVATFLTAQQRETLAAAVARIVPSDDTPGATEAGVAGYIEQLLTAFEYDPPRIFAGGPFSGRQPYGDYGSGRASTDHPANQFENFVPLTRTQEIAWRMRIYGSAVDGGDFNNAALGVTKGLRRNYTEGIALLDSLSQAQYGAGFAALGPDEQDEALTRLPPGFVSLIFEHTIEGMYAAPEYGGNRRLTGWRANKFEGDSQPLGYSIYDSIAGMYRERPDHPMSTANPGEDFAPFDDVAIEVVSVIVAGTGGKRFF